MRGKPSVVVRTGKLEVALARRAGPRQPSVKLSVFSDEEIDELAALAAKAEAAGGTPEWTADELAVFSRLEEKLAVAMGAPR